MSSLWIQAKKVVPLLILLYLPTVVGLFFLALISKTKNIPMTTFMREPHSVAKLPFYVGMVSNFGALLWAASAAVCLFGWAILRHRTGERRFPIFLLYWGLVTILLLLDDLYLLHEQVFPRFFGWNQTVTFTIYGVFALCGMILFRKCILKTEYLIFLIAFGFLGLSVLIDGFQGPIEEIVGWRRILFEDGFKLLGIVSWLGYVWRCAFIEVTAALEVGKPRPSLLDR